MLIVKMPIVRDFEYIEHQRYKWLILKVLIIFYLKKKKDWQERLVKNNESDKKS